MRQALRLTAPVSDNGKQPQADLAAEAATLTACMNRPDVAALAMSIAPPADYYSGMHREIAKAICDLLEAGAKPAPANVMLRLRETGRMAIVGGDAAIVEMINASPAVQSIIARYAGKIRDLARVRRLGETLRQLLAECYQPVPDVAEFMGRVSATVGEVTQSKVASGITSGLEVAKEIARDMAGAPPVAITTGFRGLDAVAHGFEPSALYVLAARTGMGKTAMGLQMVTAAAGAGHRVLVISLEMPRKQLVRRILSSAAGVSVKAVKDLLLSPGQMSRFMVCSSDFAKLPISFADTAGQTLLDVKVAVRSQSPKLLVVDHIGLMRPVAGASGERRSREQEVAEFSRGLKALALEFEIPVLALCQVGRDVAKGARRPTLSDLRESGAIEQDADAVWMIHRPGYYDPKASVEVQREAELIVAKNRDGETGIVPIEWDSATATFRETGVGYEP